MLSSYRQLQAEKWQKSQEKPPAPTLEEDDYPKQNDSIAIVAIDNTSLESIKKFRLEWDQELCVSDRKIFRTGVLFGTIAEDKFTVIVDAIYELPQDSITGEVMRDSRIQLVTRLSKLMGLHPVGLLVSFRGAGYEGYQRAQDLVQLINLEGAICHILFMVSSGYMSDHQAAIVPTAQCFSHVKRGTLTSETTLTGPTVNGGLELSPLQRSIAIVKRMENTIIHTGFYRLNRPNHTPTMDDAKAFIISRKTKAGIDKIHQQLADYHLIMFLADVLGESTAERIIISIFGEDDELLEDLMEVLMSSVTV